MINGMKWNSKDINGWTLIYYGNVLVTAVHRATFTRIRYMDR